MYRVPETHIKEYRSKPKYNCSQQIGIPEEEICDLPTRCILVIVTGFIIFSDIYVNNFEVYTKVVPELERVDLVYESASLIHSISLQQETLHTRLSLAETPRHIYTRYAPKVELLSTIQKS